MNMKKLTALASAFAVAISAMATGAAAVSAESGAAAASNKTVEYAESEVLFDYGYDEATTYTDCWDAHTIFTACYSDAWPAVETDDNVAISLKRGYTAETFVYLGAKYTGNKNTVTAQSISVKKGESYTIDFKYKISGVGTEAEFDFGVCTTMPANHSGNDGYNYNYVNKSVILSGIQSAGTDGWVNAKVTYTVGDITALEDGTLCDQLAIYWHKGKGLQGWIDDVKVTKNTLYSGEQLAYNDFSTSDINAPAYSGVFTVSSSDMLPRLDPDDSSNNVMECRKSSTNYSYLYFGAEYRDGRAVMADQLITVKEGEQYAIELKYKLIRGNAENLDFFDIGICTVTSNLYDYDLDQWGNNKNYSNAKNFVTKDTAAATDGWVTYRTVYTVPEIKQTANSENMDKLAVNCHIANDYYKIYIDDVSVCKVSSVGVISSDTVISDTDFSGATIYKNQWDMLDSCGDCWPVADPDNEGKKVIKYTGSTSNNGMIFAGSSMTHNNNTAKEAIAAKAGAAYKVTFSYKANGIGPLEIGVRVRKTSENAYNHSDRFNGSYQEAILSYEAESAIAMENYETVTGIVKIPANTDFSAWGDKLGLYLKGNAGITVYINHLTFEELAPSTVRFENGNGFESAVFYTGEAVTYDAGEGKTMLWYADEAKTQSVALSSCKPSGRLDTTAVYGRAVENGAPLFVGDTDMSGEFDAADLAALRKMLIGSQAMLSEYRTDANGDGAVDIRDLVRLKKITAADISGYKLNGAALSEFELVNATGELASIKDSFDKLAAIVGNNSGAANKITVSVNEKLGKNEYLVKLDGNNLVISGGSAEAANAAIISFIGHINTGCEITSSYFVSAEISGGVTPATVQYAFSEDFDTDSAKGVSIQNTPAYNGKFSNGYFGTEVFEIDNATTAVQDGCLVLTGGDKVDFEDGKYRGADINTVDSFGYGYFEIKARVNASKGICPAFWFRTAENERVDSIAYEIDVFECFGNTPEYLKGTLLAQDFNKPNEEKNEKYYTAHGFACEQLVDSLPADKPENIGTTFSYNADGWGSEWHTFGLDYQKNSITWYIDGIAVLRATTPSTDSLGTTYNFNSRIYMTLSCYAGRDVADRTGMPDETTDWENGNSLVVDYVRVIQY